MPRTTILLVASTLAVLGACAAPQDRPVLHPTFGEAVQHNIAAHVIDPAPAHADLPPLYSGRRMARAVERYHTDQVKDVEKISTRESAE